MKLLKLAGVVLAALVVLALLATLAGAFLARTHRAAVRATFAADAGTLFATLTDVEGFAAWHPGVRSARRIAPLDGRAAFEEVTGDSTVRYVVAESAPPHRLVIRIASDDLPYGGTWTFELAPDGPRTRVTATEDGWVGPPLFRLLARFVFGYHATLAKHLRALGARLGEDVAVERVPA
jgi:uncharacterized protein YndB with AHSA1/START domain